MAGVRRGRPRKSPPGQATTTGSAAKKGPTTHKQQSLQAQRRRKASSPLTAASNQATSPTPGRPRVFEDDERENRKRESNRRSQERRRRKDEKKLRDDETKLNEVREMNTQLADHVSVLERQKLELLQRFSLTMDAVEAITANMKHEEHEGKHGSEQRVSEQRVSALPKGSSPANLSEAAHSQASSPAHSISGGETGDRLASGTIPAETNLQFGQMSSTSSQLPMLMLMLSMMSFQATSSSTAQNTKAAELVQASKALRSSVTAGTTSSAGKTPKARRTGASVKLEEMPTRASSSSTSGRHRNGRAPMAMAAPHVKMEEGEDDVTATSAHPHSATMSYSQNLQAQQTLERSLMASLMQKTGYSQQPATATQTAASAALTARTSTSSLSQRAQPRQHQQQQGQRPQSTLTNQQSSATTGTGSSSTSTLTSPAATMQMLGHFNQQQPEAMLSFMQQSLLRSMTATLQSEMRKKHHQPHAVVAASH